MISLQADIKSQGAGSVELQIPQRFHPGCKLVLDTHLPPAKYTALPQHVDVSLSRGIICADCPQLSQPHERPQCSPVTSWHKVVIHQMLEAQHQTHNERLALGFYCVGIGFPCLQLSGQSFRLFTNAGEFWPSLLVDFQILASLIFNFHWKPQLAMKRKCCLLPCASKVPLDRAPLERSRRSGVCGGRFYAKMEMVVFQTLCMCLIPAIPAKGVEQCLVYCEHSMESSFCYNDNY